LSYEARLRRKLDASGANRTDQVVVETTNGYRKELTVKFTVMICAAAAGLTVMAATDVAASEQLAKKHNCLACHTVDKKVVGPPYKEIAKKYAGDKTAYKTLETKVKVGSTGVWGPIPMPPNNIPDADNKALVAWILSLK
jgi:cytochrome c